MSKLKIAVDIGHNCSYNGGAVHGSIKEDTLVKEVGTKVIKYLKDLGHTVIETLPKSATSQTHALKQRVDKANSNKVDVFVSIHFNKTSGGYGSEVYIYNLSDAEAKKVGNQILKGFADMGYRNRGVKSGSNLYVVKNTYARAYLVECAFIDSADDMKKYNPDKMARAIVEGLLGIKLSNSNTSTTDGLPNGDINRRATVTADALNVRSGRGTNYPVIGQLKKGDVVELWYCMDKWASMEKKFKDANGKECNNFVHTGYLKLI